MVVAANGRRSTAPEWLTDVGVQLPDEAVEDTGIVYYSRFFRLTQCKEAMEGCPVEAIGNNGND